VITQNYFVTSCFSGAIAVHVPSAALLDLKNI
jgi:hypothetical protein